MKTVVHIIASVVLAVVVVDLFVRDLKLGVLTLDLINFNVFVNLHLHVIALHDSKHLAFSAIFLHSSSCTCNHLVIR